MLDKEHIVDSIKSLGSGYAMIWLHSGIELFNLPEKEQELVDSIQLIDSIQQIRLFNSYQEIKYWRSQGKLKSRVKTDGNGKSELYQDVPMILRSTIAKMLPSKANETLTLITRQYIEYNKVGQAGYVDYRFVDFGSFKH